MSISPGLIEGIRRLVFVAIATILLAGGGSLSARAEGGGDASADGSAYVRLPQFSATLFEGDAPVGFISTVVLLEVIGDAERETVLETLPRLEDAFIRALHQLADAEGRLNQEYGPVEIKRAYQLIADHILGPGVVDEVLVEGITRTRNVIRAPAQ